MPYVYVTQHTLAMSEPAPEITPVMRTEIKKVKKAIAAKNKGVRLAKKAIKAAHDAFKAQAAPLLTTLKAMKREAMFGAKLADGFREGVRSFRAANTIENRFQHEFHIQNMHAPWLGFNRHWCQTPARLLWRKFRIRI